MDRAALDRAYSPSSTAHDMSGALREWTVRSEAARALLGRPRELRYGPAGRQVVDFFPAGRPGRGGKGAPLLVFLHGGYWIEGSRHDSAFLAPSFVPRGVAYAAVGYPLAPAAGLDEIVASCEQAVEFLHARARDLGVDADRVHLCGLSAGAHLAAMVATGRTAHRVRGLTAVSGVYDLRPVALSYVGEPLRLDAVSATRNSPLHRLRAGLPPLVTAYAEHDTGEFVRQSAEFAGAWQNAGNTGLLIEEAGTHHFDVVHRCGDPRSALGAAILEQIGDTS
ncbi:alpha/beta hydrolase [Streptomyces sp. S3(2020)]|nr:alpha/beta hydrolase [Streptomyces sp. S3(2020)]